MKKKLTWRLDVPHIRDCAALRHLRRRDAWHWATPWGCLDNGSLRNGYKSADWFRDSLGRRPRRGASRHYWIAFCCNDTDCPGRILVLADSIFALLPPGRCVPGEAK